MMLLQLLHLRFVYAISSGIAGFEQPIDKTGLTLNDMMLTIEGHQGPVNAIVSRRKGCRCKLEERRRKLNIANKS